MLSSWEHAESHKQFSNLSELIQILVYFITLCPGWPCIAKMKLWSKDNIVKKNFVKPLNIVLQTFTIPQNACEKCIYWFLKESHTVLVWKKKTIGRINSFGTRLGIGLVQILVLANLGGFSNKFHVLWQSILFFFLVPMANSQ